MALVARDGGNTFLDGNERRSRLGAAAVSLLIEGAVLALLVVGLAPGMMPLARKAPDLASFTTTPPPQPPPSPEAARRMSAHPAGESAPAGAGRRASPVEAPPVRLVVTPPRDAAIHAGSDSGQLAGANATGTGSGAGGAGDGTGAGSGGDGDGGGGGTDPDWIGGKIRNSDYPRAAQAAQAGGTTETALTVSAEGRVTACRVTRSSGNRELDETTCRLAAQRFRFRPARDAAGRAVAGEVDYDQEWHATPPPADD